jgi:hypothetical protein
LAAVDPAIAAGCAFRAAGRGPRHRDHRCAQLSPAGRPRRQPAGIEPVVTGRQQANRTAALSAIVAGHDVTLRGDDDTPDRYGRQPAFVFLDLRHIGAGAVAGARAALVAATVTDKDCAAALAAAEAAARRPNGESGPIPPS